MNRNRSKAGVRGQSAAWWAALSVWTIALAAIFIHVWLKPHSNTLYKVFHAGGARWLAGENLYPKVDEYIYSPFAAAFFAPLALLPDEVAGIIWRLICFAAFGGAFAAWLRYCLRGREKTFPAAWLALLPLSIGDLYNGQANPLMIGLLMLAVVLCRRERWLLAALCVGVATYFKVYPLAIGLLLCVIHPRRFPLALIAALVGIFALSLVMQRPAYAYGEYVNWVHSLPKDPRRTLNYFGTYRDFWLILRVLRVPISVTGWAALQATSAAALAVYILCIQRRAISAQKLDLMLISLGTCWMLLFGPATESSTYVILAPPLILAAFQWATNPQTRRYTPWAVVAFAFLLASQMITSWAHQHQNEYTHLVQPIGAMIFTIALLRYGWTREPELAANPAVD